MISLFATCVAIHNRLCASNLVFKEVSIMDKFSEAKKISKQDKVYIGPRDIPLNENQ